MRESAAMRGVDRFGAVLERRVVAYLIDLVPIALLTLLAASVLSVLTLLSFGLLGFLWRLLPLIAILYTAFWVAAPGSATIGMRCAGLMVRRLDGGNPSPLQALLFAALFYALVAITGWVIMLLPLVTSRHRAAHDFLSGVLVARSDRLTMF
ncbi:MAG: RDD family protein [Aliidongia sp.]